MTDIVQFTSATAAAILAIAIITSLFKPVLERAVPPANSLHDTSIRLLAVIVGVGLVAFASVAALRPHQVFDAALAFRVLVEGGKASILAIASYHLLTSSYFADSTPSVVMAPTSQPGEQGAVVVPSSPAPTVVVSPPAADPLEFLKNRRTVSGQTAPSPNTINTTITATRTDPAITGPVDTLPTTSLGGTPTTQAQETPMPPPYTGP